MPNDPIPPWVLDIRRRVGDRVRETRSARGLTQERLGERADLDRKTINRIEQGAHPTSIDHLALISRALGVPISSLFS